jgi:molybdopterin-guanine dinucleotide biosynthesis protein A
MLGVILCGGQSLRMGTDKGMLKLQANTWAQTAADKMTAMQLPLVLSVNENQYNIYSNAFLSEQLVKDNETIDLRGPLRGVLSVHVRHPQEDLFVLACDLPLMEIFLLKKLLSCYDEQKADAFAFTNDEIIEPLCSIYCSEGLSHVRQLQKTKQLQMHSMKYALEQMNLISVPLAEDEKKYFKNFNTHRELNGM